jgi:hypothetical protein
MVAVQVADDHARLTTVGLFAFDAAEYILRRCSIITHDRLP